MMTKTGKLLVISFCLGFLCLVVCPSSKADEWDKKTIITFSGPVDVAGNQLDAGTYVFKLADTTDRHVVQIFNEDETQLIATVLAIPAYRTTPRDHTTIRFAETADESAAVPVVKWFYPGDNDGQEFQICPAH